MKDTLKSNPGTRLQAALDLETALETAYQADKGGPVGQFAAELEDQAVDLKSEMLMEAVSDAVDEFASIGGSPSPIATRTHSAAQIWIQLWDRTAKILELKGWPRDAVDFALDVARDMVNDGAFPQHWPIETGCPTVPPAPVEAPAPKVEAPAGETNGTLITKATGERRRVWMLEGDIYPSSSQTKDSDLIASYTAAAFGPNGHETAYVVDFAYQVKTPATETYAIEPDPDPAPAKVEGGA